jgi:hypothetical protein
MHETGQPSNDSLVSEEEQDPLWTWLVLCDDSMSMCYRDRPFFNSVQTLLYLYTKIPVTLKSPRYLSLCDTIPIVS